MIRQNLLITGIVIGLFGACDDVTIPKERPIVYEQIELFLITVESEVGEKGTGVILFGIEGPTQYLAISDTAFSEKPKEVTITATATVDEKGMTGPAPQPMKISFEEAEKPQADMGSMGPSTGKTYPYWVVSLPPSANTFPTMQYVPFAQGQITLEGIERLNELFPGYETKISDNAPFSISDAVGAYFGDKKGLY